MDRRGRARRSQPELECPATSTRGNTPAPPPAQWKMESGVLVGGQGTGRGSLVTNEQYKDFDLDFEFMLTELGTKCSAELIGEKQENASEDKSCLYNSGVTFRTGYQVNIGRREAGEFIGIVVHRTAPGAIRVDGAGREWTVICDAGRIHAPALAQHLGATLADDAEASLDEIFVAHATH